MLVALIGLLVGGIAFNFAFASSDRRNRGLYFVIFGVHLIATGVYWALAAQDGYDAQFYYSDPLNWASLPLQSGTIFIIHFVQGLKGVFGGSFFAFFILFQSFGMIGFAFLLRTFDEIAQSLGLPLPHFAMALLFLPGMHLWTVAIGKDAFLFMAVSLSIWGSLRPARRLPGIAVAILVMAMIRPPVAVLVIISLGAALLFDRRLPIGLKAVIGAASAFGLAMVISTAQQQLDIVTLDTQGISEFVERSQNLGLKVGGGADIVGLPYPLKLLSLLFRPFFFDANGVLGLLSSVENLLLVGLFGYMAVQFRTLGKLMQSVFHLSYSVVFATTLFASLALLNYNVGLGLRQKTMGMPAVLVVIVSIALFRRFQASRPSEKAGVPEPLPLPS